VEAPAVFGEANDRIEKLYLMKSRMLTTIVLALGLLLCLVEQSMAAPPPPVPDAGSSGLLLGLALSGIVVARNFFAARK